MNRTVLSDEAFKVPKGTDLLGTLICKWPGLWVRIGRLESDWLRHEIQDLAIERPVYICGLARSGSTILLELVASLDGVATHRYKDFPPIYTPFLWNWLLARLPKKKLDPVERTHLDGIMVTPESPEAFEEVLWMTFFPQVHDPMVSNVLDERTENPGFERFYVEHVRKLLLARGGKRYVAKGNYNMTRLRYILKLFPDARFVLPVRQPVGHIASLVKQHRLFCQGEARNPRILEHMRRVGHFEFGLDRRPINTDAGARAQEVAALWENGEEIRGWARYWSQVYGYLADELDANPGLAEASLVVRFEELCRRPEESLRAVLDHCGLEPADAVIATLADRVKFPSYYKPKFSDQELGLIGAETREVARRYGY